jgi:catechol 2,3-dioxygenase-like lactoylglutathione lyase family enzyme
VDLYLVELAVADWAASVAWYRDRLGLSVELLDEPNQYALLAAGGGRVALKAGTPTPGGTKLVFHVPDLDAELARVGVAPAGPVRVSAEGYRSARLADPDGHGVELFEWAAAGPGRLH